ncbi:hypothetical protein [Streptomyces sp. NBRC 109706]|uniref:hypothetical protein n=1 Tax=Streptomyces sp. NBRC 109706 TaxID=1550035 RepID=UPI000782488F|nr:hypothetical protein [Streptomyces sp. NBRC 109706]
MPLLFLNERSYETGCAPALADRAMTELARAVVAVLRTDRDTVLVSAVPIGALQLADGYPIGKWHGNPRNRDLWRRLMLMQARSPHRAVLPAGDDSWDGVEYRHGGETVEGLGVAHLLGGLGVSLAVEARWDTDRLALEREELVEDADGEVRSETGEVTVRHLSGPHHHEAHRRWLLHGVEALRRGGLDAVRRGAELWERREVFFPGLQFLPRVEEDLRQLPAVWVQPVRDRLAELAAAVADWDPAARPIAPQWRSDVRTEFESRRRLCWFPDEERDELFDWHCEFLPKPGRIHFRLLHGERALRIAYVGRKLGV